MREVLYLANTGTTVGDNVIIVVYTDGELLWLERARGILQSTLRLDDIICDQYYFLNFRYTAYTNCLF